MSSRDVDVLVVGAGPSGLGLALQAHAHGARVRVVERRREPFRPSRALIVHPRTLEVLRPLAVSEALVERGQPAPAVRLHLGRAEVPVRLGPFPMAGVAFPFLLFVRQAEVEAVLAGALEDRGVRVERACALVGVGAGRDGAWALLDGPAGRERLDCGAVAGCDGATSTVRRLAGIGWRGGAYRSEVLLADLDLREGPAGGVGHAVAATGGVVFLFAQGERATWRLLATRARRGGGDGPGQPGAPVPLAELQAILDAAGLHARIARVAWSARIPLEHRLADRFRSGRLFLVGDAAHVHSPAGGQGMNLGLQDATNLGWKLAFAARSSTPATAEALLDSYEAERRPVDRRVLALTHLLFWGEAGRGPLARLARRVVAPLAAPFVPALSARGRLVAGALRILSQVDAGYPTGGLCASGRPPFPAGIRPGRRLADRAVTVEGQTLPVHELLARPGVHLLVGDRFAGAAEALAGPLVAVHRLEDLEGAVGVRPDGVVGYSAVPGDVEGLGTWLQAVTASSGRSGGTRVGSGSPPRGVVRRGGEGRRLSRPE